MCFTGLCVPNNVTIAIELTQNVVVLTKSVSSVKPKTEPKKEKKIMTKSTQKIVNMKIKVNGKMYNQHHEVKTGWMTSG